MLCCFVDAIWQSSNPIQSKQFYDKALTDIIRQNVYVTHFQDRLRENNLFVENIS